MEEFIIVLKSLLAESFSENDMEERIKILYKIVCYLKLNLFFINNYFSTLLQLEIYYRSRKIIKDIIPYKELDKAKELIEISTTLSNKIRTNLTTY